MILFLLNNTKENEDKTINCHKNLIKTTGPFYNLYVNEKNDFRIFAVKVFPVKIFYTINFQFLN